MRWKPEGDMAFPWQPTGNRMAIEIIDRGEAKTSSGLFLLDDDFTEGGIRPRWAQVIAVGPKVHYTNPGDFVLIPHGEWTRKRREVDANGDEFYWWITEEPKCLCVSDDATRDELLVKHRQAAPDHLRRNV